MMKGIREVKKVLKGEGINISETYKKAEHSYYLTVQIAETVIELSKAIEKLDKKIDTNYEFLRATLEDVNKCLKKKK